MSTDWCSTIPTGIRLAVQVSTNAKKTEVVGLLGDALKVRLQAQPIEGKANEALIRFIADVLNLSNGAVQITHGLTSKRKILEIRTAKLTVENVMAALVPSNSQV